MVIIVGQSSGKQIRYNLSSSKIKRIVPVYMGIDRHEVSSFVGGVGKLTASKLKIRSKLDRCKKS